jgi:hypothetical protein
MNLNRLIETRRAASAVTGAVACACLLFASSAAAIGGTGSAQVRLAQHDSSRTLSGQGINVVAGTPASKAGNILTLPVSAVHPGASPSVSSDAWLRFKRGKRGIVLSGLRFDLAAGTLNGKLGDAELAVFRLGAEPKVDNSAGTFAVDGGSLRLTAEAATLLKERFGLQRALLRKGIGMIWLAAQANPKPIPVAVVRPIVSGAIDWGFKASWRNYVLVTPPAGSQEVLDGATATGPLNSPATTYGFPGSGGSITAVPSGAVDALELTSGGVVKWAKPGHGISEVRFSDLEIEIGSGGSWLIGDVRTEIGPPAESEDVRIAELATAAVAPSWSSNGNTLTWSQVPATLTAEGAASFDGFYEAGAELDPVTITAGLG